MSEVWKYYIKIDKNVSKCLICSSKIQTSGNTSNLISHLQRRHKIERDSSQSLDKIQKSHEDVLQEAIDSIEESDSQDPLKTDSTEKYKSSQSAENSLNKTASSSKRAKPFPLKYSRLAKPPHMKSRYWKYFGFPADEDGDVITKEQVICTICNAAYAFHGNTTNLRSHLKVHRDIEWSDDEYSDKKQNVEKSSKLKTKQRKLSFAVVKKSESDNEEKPTEENLHKKNHLIQNSTIDSIIKEDNIEETEQIIVDDNMDYEHVDVTVEQEQQQHEVIPEINLVNVIQQMITNDVFHTSIVEGEGFKNLIWSLCGNSQSPSKKQVEDSISQQYKQKFLELQQTIQKHSTSNPFSLGIEIWQNVENKTMVSFYFNYILPEHPIALNNVLFQTIELSKYTNLEEIFEGINLKRCTCAIINSYNNIIANFLSIYGIETLNCFNAVITRCLKLIFEMPEISPLFADIQDIFHKHSDVFVDKATLPKIDETFPWTKYEFLKYFHDNVTFQDGDSDLPLKTKVIIDCLDLLKLTRETFAEETNSLASLIKPLISKLNNEYLSFENGEYELVVQIKNKISNELKQTLLSSSIYILTTFLDPRFHQFIQDDEMNIIYKKIENKGGKMSEISQNSSFSSKITLKSDSTDSKNPTKSILKLFFDDSKSKSSVTPKISAEQEIIKYKNEAFADLEQCPLDWWWRMGYGYKHLKNLAEDYNCVPSCINNNLKKSMEEQIEYHYRRLVLRNSDLTNKILFLNYNKIFFK